MNRIPWRLFLYILLPLGIFISILGWLILHQIEEQVESRMKREVEIIGRALRTPIRQAIMDNQEFNIQESLSSVFRIGSVYGAFVYDHNGKLLARAGRGGDDPRYRNYIVRMLENKRTTGEYIKFDELRVYSAFIPILDPFGKPVGLIQINRNRSEIKTSMGNIRLRAVFIFLGMIIIISFIVLIGHYVAQGRAISSLLYSIDRIKKGDHFHKAQVKGPKEISTLAEALNSMMNSLNIAREEIRERKAIEGILREQALRNDRLVALGQLAGGIAHELGGPLSVILGMIRRLKRKSAQELSQESQNWLSQMESEAHRTEAVVNQLLDFGTPKTHLEAHDLENVITKAIEAADPDLQKNNSSVKIRKSGTPVPIQVNPLRFSLAVRNLLSNASRHAPNSQILLQVKFFENEVSISVRDQGEGIPPKMVNKIFEPFVSTVEDGHGLGLALVQKVAQEHNGIVRAQNLSDGCEFRIIIPIHQTKS